ncbi:MAG: response regulator [Defluviitaleaceae bacterium]|nr:response regulator [Defluviitaleaceae bacterium]
MKIIFIVDDNDTSLMAAKLGLSGKYKTYAMPSAAQMFKLLKKITPDLILLDVDMPVTDGYSAIRLLKSDANYKEIPVIFLTGKHDTESELLGFELGALDFVIKPFSPPVLIQRIETHLETDKLIKESQKALCDLHNATISVIAGMVESRDKITGCHIERTQAYLSVLLDELIRTGVYKDEIAAWDLSLLVPSAQLHDVGKIVISDTILNKPDKLTSQEFEIIKMHTTEGEKIIDMISEKTHDDGFLRHARLFAGCHHEKWDGSGYPYGYAGDAIPLEGRLMAVVDVYDSLRSERPYKKPMPHAVAMEIIKNESGKHFDPLIVEAFLNAKLFANGV